ncbi:hypothetical protein BDP27DRAFT_1366635 [Rhodocollybia butyracea]|uniref:Uncharacterized protein n=1 Tax=Rhodocollybia butyracea TaxID=206335 RepID=A0A9P5U424_9AGAR|nr:hypothetical protein BDP27DRAFT_1366635 [Rhodocollybia butyracea]
MPHISVKNNTNSHLKVGFFVLGMLHTRRWTNNLGPGETFDAGYFPSLLPQSFEIRQERGGGFDEKEILRRLALIATAGASGTAAVVTGTVGVLRGSALKLAVAGLLWNVAHAAGAQCAQEAPDSIKRVKVSVGFSNIKLVICTGEADIEVWQAGKRL